MQKEMSTTQYLKKGKYQHYKGQYYEVIDVVMHSEDESILVLYRPLYETQVKTDLGIELWVRPLDMFTESVESQDGKKPRFAYSGPMS
jgi:hypothetical protein